ncbi:MAG: OadG family protein [Clostridia bacterium]|nr:OadG family protein [Clostridia bacterium]
MVLQNMLLNATEKVAGAASEATAKATEKAANFEVLSGSEPFGERLLYGLRVAAIGMLVVFLVLIILWTIVTALGKIFGKQRKNPEVAKKPADAPEAVSDLSNASEEETVVAVAAAAIAAYEDKAEIDFDIVSVTPISFTEEKK